MNPGNVEKASPKPVLHYLVTPETLCRVCRGRVRRAVEDMHRHLGVKP